MAKELRVTMPDNSVWGVPVQIIANHRAGYYRSEYGNDLQRSLNEDTLPLFESDPYEVEDWAANNMDWKDVQPHARLITAGECDFDEGWANGEKEVAEAADDE